MNKGESIINEIVEYNEGIPCHILTSYYDGSPFYPQPGKTFVPLHWHKDVEINFSIEANIATQINGCECEGQDDSFIIINSGYIHGNTYATKELTDKTPRRLGICLRISDSFFRKILPNFDCLEFNTIWKPSTGRPKEIAIELSKYGYPDSHLGKYENLLVDSLIYELVYYLCKENLMVKDDSLSDSDKRNLDCVREIMTYIENNYKNPIDEVSLANKFGYTPTYFSKIFKKYANITYKEFLTKTRIAAAKQQLIESTRDVTSIAMDCGFSDVRGLINSFKKIEGITPNAYRKNPTK